RTQEQRVMIMLTAREPELAKSPNASRLKDVLPALALRPVELPPLTDEDMAQVLTALAAGYNRAMSPAVRRALLRASAGIPMVAELLFDDWRAHGGQCLALGIGAMTVDAQLHAGQDVFLQVVERAVSKLSDIGRAVVGLAAVLGDRLNDLGMYELVDLTLAQTLAGMSELTTMRILRDTGQCLEFRNELLRGYSYLSVPSPHRRALHGLIADRLIAAETSGETVPGLTLAWHCYRASRVEAAEQYLLRGARTALDRGATFETELALRSAMPTLQKERLGDALLLLAESLQEQGRWQESLEVLKHEGPWDEPLRIIASGFQIRARAALSEDEEELRLFVGQTVALLDAPADISLKVPVINTISVLSWRLQANDALLDRLLELFDVATQQTARASLVAAILTVAWRTRGPDALIGLRPLAAQVSDECDRAGVRNGTRFHLENARSCLEASLCSYEEALRLAHVAHDLAVHLGDDERQSVAASNIAMYLGRLGRYLEQEEWARRALATAAGVGRSWRLDRVRFQLAWALAMSGRTSRALEESLPNESNLGGAPMWMIQANGLLKADILQVCGDPNGALRVARQTLEATGLAPLSTAYAGLTARWIALSTAGSPLQAKGREILEDLLARLDTLDAFDQTEVCAAMCRFQRQQGVDFRATKEELQRKLSTLPEAAAHTLHRLGLLSDLN
ncbi:MAG TPA: hypothetical protein VG692_08105, partial [Gemmatimonadales bacterium]|nr:hypothetical protein [Gemmatimonadales bacterium]